MMVVAVLLSLLVCREAQFEPYVGQLAVAQTVINRADHPGWWGHDARSVILAPYQYSPMTVPGDAGLTRWTVTASCRQAAQDALARTSPMVPPGADSFYAEYIKAPKWATPERFVKQVGTHKFYNMDGK